MREQEFSRLRSLAGDYRRVVSQAELIRVERDSIALRLVDGGSTWREVAEAAGFSNPYIAMLKRKRAVAQIPPKYQSSDFWEQP